MAIVAGNPYLSGIDPQWMQLWNASNPPDDTVGVKRLGLASLADDDMGPALAVAKSPLPEPAVDVAPVTRSVAPAAVIKPAAQDAGVFAPVVARAQAAPAAVAMDTASPAGGGYTVIQTKPAGSRGYTGLDKGQGGGVGIFALQRAAKALGMEDNPFMAGVAASGNDPRPHFATADQMNRAYSWFRQRGLDYYGAQRANDPRTGALIAAGVPEGSVAYGGEPNVYLTKRFIDPKTHQGPGVAYIQAGGKGAADKLSAFTLRNRPDLAYGINPYYQG